MQLKAVVVAILAAGAFSQQLPVTDPVGVSVLSVLATAIPGSVQQSALENPSSFGAEIASSIAAGNPPAWYTALPSDVKSILPSMYPGGTVIISTPTPTPAITSYPTGVSSSVSAGPTGANSTVSTVSSATLGSTGGANLPTTVFTGGAALPTAVFGAGFAGALGVLGMLAL